MDIDFPLCTRTYQKRNVVVDNYNHVQKFLEKA